MTKSNIKAAQQVPAQEPTESSTKKVFWFCLVLLLSVLFAYAPALENDFTNWDDNVYVTENPLIKKLDWESVAALFSPANPVSSNYHPVTMLSLAWNYNMSGLNPVGYIATNIFIHLLATFLLFFWVRQLIKGRVWIAGITAFLFAVHPMHVESVAWISERKDVLYGLFFFAGLLAYMRYLEAGKLVYLWLTFLLFVLSCLSKAMAVVFPVALLLIDFYAGRKLSGKVILEKIPFFLISIFIGYLAWKIQAPDAINDFNTFMLGQRLMFSSYGFILYIAKFLFPFNLSAYYPYPEFSAQGNLPWYFYLMPFLMLSVLLFPFFVYRKNREAGLILLAGIAFYLLTVALVLQFVSVGRTIMADRYSYLSYVGLSLIAAWFIDKFVIQPRRFPAAIILIIVGILFIYVTSQRVEVWKNSETLWTDVIQKYPAVPVAYKNRSDYYLAVNRQEEAFNDLVTLTKLPEKDAGGFNNLGNMYSMRQQHAEAIAAYSGAIKIDPKNFDAYLNRAIAYSILKQYDRAFSDFRKAELIKPESDKIHPNLAYAYYYAGKFPEAIQSFDKAINTDSGNANLYFFRGLSYFNGNQFPEAINDFTKASELKPDFSDAYFNLSVIYNQTGRYPEAYQAALKAQQYGFQVPPRYLDDLKSKSSDSLQ